MQWSPGDGHPNCSHWPEVYQKIVAAKKNTQVYGDLEVLDAVMSQIGTGKGIYLMNFTLIWGKERDSVELRKKLARYGVE